MAAAPFATKAPSTAVYCRSMGLRALSPSRLSALDHQKGGAVGLASRRLPHGRWIHPSQSHPATYLLSRTPRLRSGKLPGCAAMAAPGYFIRGVLRSRASRLNTLAHEQVFQCLTHALHSQVLSSSLIRCINKCSQARTNNCQSVTRAEKCKPQ